MSAVTQNRFNPFSGWSLPIWFSLPKSDPVEIDERDRRAYLSQLMTADYNGCGNEAGACALMAMFPRDF